MTWDAIVILSVLAFAAVWDLTVIVLAWRRMGKEFTLSAALSTGKTFSWLLYTDSRTWPVVGYAAGYASCWMYGAPDLRFLFAFVAGHIFATMKGA